MKCARSLLGFFRRKFDDHENYGLPVRTLKNYP